MSTTVAFDTYAYVRKLRDAGVDERQAEIQTEALMTLVEDRLATKQDMFMLKRDLAEVEANLKRDLKEMDVKAEIRFRELDAKSETNLKELDVKAEIRFRELDVNLRELDAKSEASRRELDVKAETRFRELDVKAETRFRELDGKIETCFKELDSKIETTKAELKRNIKELDGKIETSKAEILAGMNAGIATAKVDSIKWTAGMFVAQTALIIGAMFAMLKMNQPNPQPVGFSSPPAQETRLPVVPHAR